MGSLLQTAASKSEHARTLPAQQILMKINKPAALISTSHVVSNTTLRVSVDVKDIYHSIMHF